MCSALHTTGSASQTTARTCAARRPILTGQDADASAREQALSNERMRELIERCSTYMLRRTCGVMVGVIATPHACACP